jgi:hypothetical protein
MQIHRQTLASVLAEAIGVWQVEVLAVTTDADAFWRHYRWQVQVERVLVGEPPSASTLACVYSEGRPHRRQTTAGSLDVSPLVSGSGLEAALRVGDRVLLLAAPRTQADAPQPVLRIEPEAAWPTLRDAVAAQGRPLRDEP